MLRQPRGWAWDVDILEEVELQGVTHTEILDAETGKKYRAAIKDFWEHGVIIDRGHGKQMVLPISYWQISVPGQPQAKQLALAL